MKPLTAILPDFSDRAGASRFAHQVELFTQNPLIARTVVLHQEARLPQVPLGSVRFLQTESWFSSESIERALDAVTTDYLLLVVPGHELDISRQAVERMLAVMDDTQAGIIYADFRDLNHGQVTEHPTIDYQLGSIRDSFDFGSLLLISKQAADQARQRYGRVESAIRWGGLYDLRLKISIDSAIVRIPEPLYTRCSVVSDEPAGLEPVHQYVDPSNREYQLEMERIATAHLRRIGAFLEPVFQSPPAPETAFPVMASIIIPVRNREKTIADAIHSALSQEASFPYNVIVIDNHSTDGTTEIVESLARSHKNLIHKIPQRTDLGIGGCWNEAIDSPECGLFAVQLDSDDLYRDTHALQTIVDKFWESSTGAPRYAMVIGSYTTVNFNLEETPPGLIDHREWTRENGRNNALRILGLGAPRAFYVPVLRQIKFPNTSYGEDYAVSLRISRDYEIGRIYESLYLVRRWEGNTDRALPLATMNRYDAYKDWLRTVEIRARMKRR